MRPIAQALSSTIRSDEGLYGTKSVSLQQLDLMRGFHVIEPIYDLIFGKPLLEQGTPDAE